MKDKVKEYIKKCEKEDLLPNEAGFALYLGIPKESLDRVKHRKALALLDTATEEIALQKGLTGEYKSAVVTAILRRFDYDKPESSSGVVVKMETPEWLTR